METAPRVSVLRGSARCRLQRFNDLRRQADGGGLVADLHLHGRVNGYRREAAMQFIRPRQVLEMVGVSRTTLWRMVRAGTFPRPVQITERNRGYLLDAVEAWMKARAEGLALPLAARPVRGERPGKSGTLLGAPVAARRAG